MRDKILLWKGKAPYSNESPGQEQPTLTDFSVPGSKGAVIVVPGGGYTMKAPHEGAPVARILLSARISAFVLDYRVRPCNIEAPLADALRAIRVVRSMGYEKVAILGFSAGGHLTCSAATLWTEGDPTNPDPIERLSARPDAFIPCYAVVSFASYRHQGSLESLLGEKKDDYALIRRYSAELHINERTPEAFIWHTADDGLVPVENSLRLASALSVQGIPYELHIFPHGRHGLGLALDDSSVSQWSRLLQKWLVDRDYD